MSPACLYLLVHIERIGVGYSGCVDFWLDRNVGGKCSIGQENSSGRKVYLADSSGWLPVDPCCARVLDVEDMAGVAWRQGYGGDLAGLLSFGTLLQCEKAMPGEHLLPEDTRELIMTAIAESMINTPGNVSSSVQKICELANMHQKFRGRSRDRSLWE